MYYNFQWAFLLDYIVPNYNTEETYVNKLFKVIKMENYVEYKIVKINIIPKHLGLSAMNGIQN